MSHLILSCEHASDSIPPRFRSAFGSRKASLALASHRGVDFGAAAVARSIAVKLGAPCLYGRFSRLLIDLNRTVSNPRRFSEFTRASTSQWKTELDEIHQAHWRAVRSLIDDSKEPVIHVAVHTFSPVMKGKVREMDLGILYDPHRERELRWARWVQQQIQEETGLRVRRNAP
jgi:predicted N-formylglutamate amidohydrolase